MHIRIISAPEGALTRVVLACLEEGKTTRLYDGGKKLFIARATAEDLAALATIGIVAEEIKNE